MKCAGEKRSYRAAQERNFNKTLYKNIPGYPLKKTHTDIEWELSETLDKLGLTHTHHYSPDNCNYIFDEYLPDENILIEADGEYYHHSKWAEEQGVPQRDEEKDQWAINNGYELIRLRGWNIREFGAEACLLPHLVKQSWFEI